MLQMTCITKKKNACVSTRKKGSKTELKLLKSSKKHETEQKHVTKKGQLEAGWVGGGRQVMLSYQCKQQNKLASAQIQNNNNKTVLMVT